MNGKYIIAYEDSFAIIETLDEAREVIQQRYSTKGIITRHMTIYRLQLVESVVPELVKEKT